MQNLPVLAVNFPVLMFFPAVAIETATNFENGLQKCAESSEFAEGIESVCRVSSMTPAIDKARQFIRLGNRRAAAEICERMLAAEPVNAEALHLLGVIRLFDGATEQAIDFLGQAVAAQPSAADFQVNLAEAYRANGESPRAVDCCYAALRLRPDHASAFNTLGLALVDLQNHAAAVEAFSQAIAAKPAFAAAHNNLGVALRGLGQHDRALDHFRETVKFAPDFAPGRANLGRLLLDRGQPVEALPHSEAAVRLDPKNADPLIDLANVLVALKRLPEACEHYLAAIRLAPTHPVPHVNLGRLLRDEGRLAEAVSSLKTALELDPENAGYWSELADLHWELDAAPAAMACWERALALEPQRALARNALGWAMQEEGRLSDAKECYDAALLLQPNLAPAHLNLGVYHEEKGELSEAEACYRETIRLQPAFALAHSRLATLLRGKLPEADLAAIEACLGNPQLDDAPRARLLFALAHVLDARNDPPRAADCLEKANLLSLEENRRRLRNYDSVTHDKFVDSLIAGFDRSWFERTAGCGLPSRRPVFVIGLPRSGTTLVEQILASHPAVHGAGELALGRRGFEAIPGSLGRKDSPLRCLASLDSDAISRIAARHLDQLARLAPETAERIVDKMPENYLYLGWLVTLFPNATIIHCRRDLRDVALSCWMTDFRTLRWTNSPEHLATRLQSYCRLMAHWDATCPTPIHAVRYEETVADLEGVARRLISACGLEWDRACLEFHQNRRTVRTASVTQVRQPIYSTSISRWKKYESVLADLFALLPQD